MSGQRRTAPSLPLSSLRLHVPPLRLVSAALWQVVQRRDIMDYGLVEEFVSTVFQVVPDLMSYRERVQLIMGLRAQLVLELFCKGDLAEPDTVQPHLNRLSSGIITLRENEVPDPEVEVSESNFQKLIQTLLEDPVERENFFQNVFPEEFGPKFDSALQTLVWEFLSRLEKLLPTPTFQQTASWISADHSILEECVQSVCNPEPLKTLLQYHNSRYEYVYTNALSSLDNYILSSLSLSPLKKAQIIPNPTEPEMKSELTEDLLPCDRMNIPSPASSDPTEMRCLFGSDCVRTGVEMQKGSYSSPSCLLRQPTLLLHRLDLTRMPFPVYSPVLSPTLNSKGLQIGNVGSQLRRGRLVISSVCGGVNGQPPTENELDRLTSNGEASKKKKARKGRAFQEEKLQHPIKDLHSEENIGQNRKPAEDLIANMRSHTDPSCYQCLERFEDQEDFQKPQQTGCEEPAEPEEDNMSTESVEEDIMSFKDEMKPSQPQGFSPRSSTKISPTPLTFSKNTICRVCHKTFNSKYLMRKHLKSEHGQLPYQCYGCADIFRTMVHFREHKAECKPSPFSKARQCCFCNKTFYSSYLMRKHLKSQHDQLPYQCPGCGGQFKTKFNLNEHKKECLVAKSLFSCAQCDKTFIKASYLTKHTRSHTNPCTQCLQSFEHQEDLQKHLQNVLEEASQLNEDDAAILSFEDVRETSRPRDTSNVLPTRKESSKARTCRLCHTTLKSVHLMKMHLNSKHSQHPYQCLLCEKNFRKKSNLKEHLEACHKPTPKHWNKPRTCRACQKTLASVHLLRKHLESEHNLLLYQCVGCGENFKRKSCLLEHKNVCSLAKTIHSCCECGETFKLSKLKACYQVQPHQSPREGQQDTGPIGENTMESCNTTPRNLATPPNIGKTCILCYQTFENGEDLRNHLKCQHDTRPYPFPDCGETFQSKSELQKHSDVHLGSRKCPTCVTRVAPQSTPEHVERRQQDSRESNGVVSPNTTLMDVNPSDDSVSLTSREHETERPQPLNYLCETCGKIFPSLYQLKRHLRVHTGEQPFPCTDCGKRFTCKGSLKNHRRLHTGERPFACTLCQEHFVTNNHLKRHMFVHTRVKPFQCLACGKTFKTKQGWRRHQFQHCDHSKASCIEKDLQGQQQTGCEEAAQP
uniref:C2H2-type domain-containing protein n=1 Tax=Esox lucius TaxID=8010 RepID=A0AAY5K1G7_ESOLU